MDEAAVTPASRARRALALAYEALLLAALLLACSLPFVMLAQPLGREFARPLFQVYLLLVAGAYFVWQWQRGGRTLAMKTWRLRLVARDGGPVTWRLALKRFLYAAPATLVFGAGFLWALIDRDGLFLHDRLAGTIIIKEEKGESRKEKVSV